MYSIKYEPTWVASVWHHPWLLTLWRGWQFSWWPPLVTWNMFEELELSTCWLFILVLEKNSLHSEVIGGCDLWQLPVHLGRNWGQINEKTNMSLLLEHAWTFIISEALNSSFDIHTSQSSKSSYNSFNIVHFDIFPYADLKF